MGEKKQIKPTLNRWKHANVPLSKYSQNTYKIVGSQNSCQPLIHYVVSFLSVLILYLLFILITFSFFSPLSEEHICLQL